jgi:integrase
VGEDVGEKIERRVAFHCVERAVARSIHRLSVAKIAKANHRGLYGDGGGLYLQVAANGSRSWLFRYSRNNRTRYIGLGAIHSVSVDEARDQARNCRRSLHDGIDPLDNKKAQQAAARLEAARAVTFDQCAKTYIDSHQAGWKNRKHAAQWRSTLATYVTPVFGKLPIQHVDTSLVMKVLDPIWQTKPETASRLRGRIEAILSFATVRGDRQGENPARWKGHLDQLLPARGKVRAVEHHAALAYDEIGTFMSDLRSRGAIAARALEFLILTAGRTSEILNSCWAEIDLRNKVWVVPASRMKGKREHRVPLSHAALAVLEKMKAVRDGDFIFPGAKRDKPLSNMSLLALIKRMERGDLTTHGFRSTFRDWAAERSNFPNEVVEMALAHAISSKAEAAYRRRDLFDKRRKLMDAWASFCARGAEGVSATVIQLRS